MERRFLTDNNISVRVIIIAYPPCDLSLKRALNHYIWDPSKKLQKKLCLTKLAYYIHFLFFLKNIAQVPNSWSIFFFLCQMMQSRKIYYSKKGSHVDFERDQYYWIYKFEVVIIMLLQELYSMFFFPCSDLRRSFLSR